MMPATLRLVAAIAVVLMQLMLLGRGACPTTDEPASRAHAHHESAPAPASDEPAEPPHDGGACYMTSACGSGGIYEATVILAVENPPHAGTIAFVAFAPVITTPSPEPPPPRG